MLKNLSFKLKDLIDGTESIDEAYIEMLENHIDKKDNVSLNREFIDSYFNRAYEDPCYGFKINKCYEPYSKVMNNSCVQERKSSC